MKTATMFFLIVISSALEAFTACIVTYSEHNDIFRRAEDKAKQSEIGPIIRLPACYKQERQNWGITTRSPSSMPKQLLNCAHPWQ